MIGVGTGKGFLVYQPPWVVGLYRERPSGVPTALNHGVGTGKGHLVYQLPWIVDLVQEKAVWCTNRLESWVWYRKRLSGVPTALNRGFVQGKAVCCTNALNRGFWAVETFLEYKTLWLENLVYDWVCGHWDCWSDWWKCKVSLQWVLNFFTLLEKWLIAKILTNN